MLIERDQRPRRGMVARTTSHVRFREKRRFDAGHPAGRRLRGSPRGSSVKPRATIQLFAWCLLLAGSSVFDRQVNRRSSLTDNREVAILAAGPKGLYLKKVVWVL